MKEVNAIFTHKLDELTVNILQGLVVRSQSLNQLWRRGVLGHNCTTDPFKAGTPFCNI